MKTANKVILINISIAVFITVLLIVSYGGMYNGSETAFAFGIVCLAYGIITLFIGLILLFTRYREVQKGFLLSGALLLLLSGVSCGGGAMF